ncbi:MAG: polyhydroxyalkanoate depolymerase [Micavibrio aeruginosavorus]|uniref:Polyhydroxyalkanoate depolymerase n=1 Tax=Micavibrio aeruginosavorus TaxID=349221 RepID=A0A2W5PVP7_9BACT|nr:MAG: polyhydroxyalkanoate depolymerase [Micavibrio aeruginosavorus]
MLYQLYDLQHALLTPARIAAELIRTAAQNPWNPLSYTQAGRTIAAGAEVFERVTRKFGEPDWSLHTTTIDGKSVEVLEEIIVEKPFCHLMHFKRATKRKDPRVLVVAPMSGHYATLLRGTVEALLPHHDVYVTDWLDARQVPLKEGKFNLDDFITYLREFMALLGPKTHLIAVCQPAVPVLAAVSLMASENDPNQPLTMTLMGGPIDTRISKTAVNKLAEERPLSWFENAVIDTVPAYYPGAFRKVYPGFTQLSGFMSMNLDRHVGSHMKFFQHLVQGDGESAEFHRKFYNEYNAVMDITAEFYIQTIDTVFQRHLLPRGQMKWRDPLTHKLVDVKPSAIEHTALFTIEGELDDISSRGQTTSAHDLCYNLPQRKQFHLFQLKTGHYGIFNGSKWKTQIMPRIRHFMREFDPGCDAVPAKDLDNIPDIAPDRFNRDTHGVAAVRRWLKERDAKTGKEREAQD